MANIQSIPDIKCLALTLNADFQRELLGISPFCKNFGAESDAHTRQSHQRSHTRIGHSPHGFCRSGRHEYPSDWDRTPPSFSAPLITALFRSAGLVRFHSVHYEGTDDD